MEGLVRWAYTTFSMMIQPWLWSQEFGESSKNDEINQELLIRKYDSEEELVASGFLATGS